MDRQRTFGIVAHIDAGKTTLTERILHDCGAQAHVGSVDEGTAAMDWLPQERSRGISITAAATRVMWSGHSLQVVDTPGHVDFAGEVERCLWVLDGVVVVVDGVRGAESQTETVWQQADARALPRLVFVNKLDRAGADFATVVADLAERFACRAVPIVVPLRDDKGAFAGLGHAVTGAVQWFAGRPDAALVPRLSQELQRARERVAEAAADLDDGVLADVVAGRPTPPERLRAALRAGAIRGAIVPVFAGAALWNRGVDWLLDGIVDLLPGPADVARAGIWSVPSAGAADAPFCGIVFKVQHGDAVWNFVRVVRGIAMAGSACVRVRGAQPVVLPELWVMQADRHQPVAAAGPGEIVVLPGDLGLRTGDSLGAPEHPVALPMPRLSAPVLAVTFEPERSADGPRLFAALRELAVDDPTLRVDNHHGQIVVRGMGELHLDVVAEFLRERLDVPFARSRPRVAQRETVAGPGRGEAEVRAVIAGRPCAVRCRLGVEPLAEGSAAPARVEFESGDVATAAAAAEVEVVLPIGTRVGAMCGFVVRIEGVEVTGDGVDGLLAQAALRAFENALDAASLTVLEPWVEFEVTCPEEGGAAVLADLGTRGAEVASVYAGQLGARVRGAAPLARMLGYVTRLRSMTKGLGQASLRPSGYRPVGA